MSRVRNIAELLLLFAALFCLLPYIQSHEGFEYRFGLIEVLAIVLFGFSRGLRWGEQWVFALIEIIAFAVFAWVLVRCYHLILTS